MNSDIVSLTLDVEGVGLVLYDDDGRILIVFEGRNKPLLDKRAGDAAIPLETMERNPDGTLESFEQALQRTLDEEVGFEVRIADLSMMLEFVTSFGVPLTIFCAKFEGASRMGGTAIETGELLGWEWIFPEDLIGRRMRGGMQEILAAYNCLVHEQYCEQTERALRVSSK